MFYWCQDCKRIIKVLGDLEEVALLIRDHKQWSDGRPCITEHCSGQMEWLPTVEVAMRAAMFGMEELPVHDFFRALCGFGTPSEIASDPEVVKALLVSEKIVDVKVRASYARTVIDSIDLENGLRLHLTLGSEGAVVYKITRFRDVKNVAHDQGGVHQDPQVDSVQRGDRLHEGGGGGGDDQGDGSVGRVPSSSIDGGSHPNPTQETGDSPRRQDHDGSENEGHEADTAGG